MYVAAHEWRIEEFRGEKGGEERGVGGMGGKGGGVEGGVRKQRWTKKQTPCHPRLQQLFARRPPSGRHDG